VFRLSNDKWLERAVLEEAEARLQWSEHLTGGKIWKRRKRE
jgi:hypothetical protein